MPRFVEAVVIMTFVILWNLERIGEVKCIVEQFL